MWLYQKKGSLWGALKIWNQERKFSVKKMPIRSLRNTMRQLNNETPIPVSSFNVSEMVDSSLLAKLVTVYFPSSGLQDVFKRLILNLVLNRESNVKKL